MKFALANPTAAGTGDLLNLARMGGNRAMVQRLATAFGAPGHAPLQRFADMQGANEDGAFEDALNLDEQGANEDGAFEDANEDDVEFEDALDERKATSNVVGTVEQAVAVEALAPVGTIVGEFGSEAHKAIPNSAPAEQFGQSSAAGVGIGAAFGGVGAGIAFTKIHQARKRRAAAPAGSAEWYAASRDLEAATADATVKAGSTVSGVSDTVGKGMALAGNASGAVAGAVATGVAAPIAVLVAARDMRKAGKAVMRARRLGKLGGKWATESAQRKRALDSLSKDRRNVEQLIASATDEESRESLDSDLEKIVAVYEDIKALDDHLMGGQGQGNSVAPTLTQIRAFANKKNRRGAGKKGGASIGTAVGAGVAVAALAGATGPAIIGVGVFAAAIGLGFAGYRMARGLRKRYQRSEGMRVDDGQGGQRELTNRERRALAMKFWRESGPSTRDTMAEALYDHAAGDGFVAEEAREIISALGLDWDAVNMAGGREASIAMIKAKMAS